MGQVPLLSADPSLEVLFPPWLVASLLFSPLTSYDNKQSFLFITVVGTENILNK
jgi:hypothetical protein